MGFKITVQYTSRTDKGSFIVKDFRESTGASLVEALSKFILEIVQLQRDIHQEEMDELKRQGNNDDIPF